MAKTIKLTAAFATVITIFFDVLYRNTKDELALTLAITFGTVSYHFIMRLLVGFLINYLFDDHVDYRRRWFQVSDIEQKFYDKIKVKHWKGKMPTYDPTCFDRRIHTWDEIAQAMCQAEMVHEIIIILSFVPVFASIPFGSLFVFIITSILAACYDAIFVMLQRYNRPRIIKLVEKDV